MVDMHFEEWMLVSGVLLLLSIFSWKVSNKLGIPALVLFLALACSPVRMGQAVLTLMTRSWRNPLALSPLPSFSLGEG
jgi:hypothetical protein